jgi:hypothetical protein
MFWTSVLIVWQASLATLDAVHDQVHAFGVHYGLSYDLPSPLSSMKTWASLLWVVFFQLGAFLATYMTYDLFMTVIVSRKAKLLVFAVYLFTIFWYFTCMRQLYQIRMEKCGRGKCEPLNAELSKMFDFSSIQWLAGVCIVSFMTMLQTMTKALSEQTKKAHFVGWLAAILLTVLAMQTFLGHLHTDQLQKYQTEFPTCSADEKPNITVPAAFSSIYWRAPPPKQQPIELPNLPSVIANNTVFVPLQQFKPATMAKQMATLSLSSIIVIVFAAFRQGWAEV